VNSDSSPAVSIERQEGVWVVRLTSPLGTLDWAELEAAGNMLFERLLSSRRPRCLVDLSDLPALGSVQMALLVQTWKRIHARGGRCIFAAPHKEVREVFSIAGLDRLWEIVPTPEAAFERLRPTPRGGAVRWTGWTLALGGTAMAVAGRLMNWGGLELAFPPHWLVFSGAALGGAGGVLVAVWERSLRRYLGVAAAMACGGLAAWEWRQIPRLPIPVHGRGGRVAAHVVCRFAPVLLAPDQDSRPPPCPGPLESGT
jgi:anti-anti-sigma factor